MARGGINVRVVGANQCIANLHAFSERKIQQIKETVVNNTLRAEADAKRGAPVDTGFMRNNIHASWSSSGLRGVVTSHANYSFFVEFGTRKAPAQPFMFPAFLIAQRRFIQDLERVMQS